MDHSVLWDTVVSLQNSSQDTRHQHKNRQVKRGIAVPRSTEITEQFLQNDATFLGWPDLVRLPEHTIK